jgi:DNA-binding transcriptional regulator LsrR (DeoR family)
MAQKIQQLHYLLGMTYKEIAKALNINKKTAIKAYWYEMSLRGVGTEFD